MNQARMIRGATQDDTAAIVTLCTRAARAAYGELVTPDYLDRVIAHFYNVERVSREIAPAAGWFGFVVAQEAARVVGVAGTEVCSALGAVPLWITGISVVGVGSFGTR